MENLDKKQGEPSKGAKIAAIIIMILILSALVGLFSDDSPQKEKTNDAKAVAVSDEPAKEDKKPADDKKESLAEKVDKKYKENWGIDSYTSFLLSEDYPPGSIVGYINGMEDVSSGTIRVNVQTDITKEQGEGLAKNILGMVGLDIEELDWVVVRGVDGRDYQASRNSIPLLR